VSQPHFEASVRRKLALPKVGTWTPETSELDCRGQNTLPSGVIYTIGKVWKCRCRKWPYMSIRTSTTQVMVERKADSQIANLTPDH